jgi:hypothetical protein
VIIENCRITSAGFGISSYETNAHLTVRNCHATALNPNVAGKSKGFFLKAVNASSVVVEHNLIEGFSNGPNVVNWPPDTIETFSGQNIVFRYNLLFDLDGRRSDGQGGYQPGHPQDGTSDSSSALQTYLVRNADIEIAWNAVINHPYVSQPEDSISTAESRGLPAKPIHIHDNYIQGDNPADAPTYETFGGCGIQLGDSPSETEVGYTSVHDNQVVNFSSCGISISSGHDNDVHDNRIISARTFPDGTLLSNQWRLPMQLHDFYWDPNYNQTTVADPFWHDNWLHDNAFAAVKRDGTVATNTFDHLGPTVGEYGNHDALGHLATTADENAESVLWQQKLADNGISVGLLPMTARFGKANYAVSETAGKATIDVIGDEAVDPSLVQFATSDGTAVAGVDYEATAGTLTFPSGATRLTFMVPVLHNPAATGVRTVLLRLSAMNGARLETPDTAVLTITDHDAAGKIQLSSSAYSVNAQVAATSVTVTVKRSGGSAPVSVHFATSDGTAIAGVDYTKTLGDLTFGPPGAGATTQGFTVPVARNVTGAKNFGVTLSTPMGGAVLGTPTTASITVLGAQPTFAFGNAAYYVKTSQPSALITVKRSAPLTGLVTVGYSTTQLTAVPGTDYKDVSGTLTFGSGLATRTFSVPVIKDPYVDVSKTVRLSLSAPTGNATIDPVLGSATLNITDPNLVPALQFSAASYTVNEATPKATITVKRTGDLAGTVTVDCGVTAGTATPGADYGSPLPPNTLTFGPGKTVETFPITIVNDLIDEGTETVNLGLSNASWDKGTAVVGALGTAVLNITDNEPTVQFSAPTYSVSEVAKTASVVVKRTGGLNATATVDYAVTGGTAVDGGVDYTLASPGTLTFLANQSSMKILIAVVNDTVAKGPRTIDLALGNPSGTEVGTPAMTVVTIKDNDVAGKVQFSASDYGVSVPGVATVTVTRTGGIAGGATIDYATSDGTAVAGTHYQAAAGTLTFGAGETTKTFSIASLDDGLSDGNHNVNVILTNPQGGAALGPTTHATLWIVE